MPKTNDEILSEYKERFYSVMADMAVATAENNTDALKQSDMSLMMETIHIVDSFLANPEKPLLQAKLAYDLDDYTGKWDHLQFTRKLGDTITFFTKWKPGALFV